MTEAASRTEIYAHMLELQAELQLPFERHFFATKQWKKARSVLDFGCGDLSYTTRIDKITPGKQFFSVEQDSEMRKLARARATSNIDLVGSLNEIPTNVIFDFILLRLVLLHVENRDDLYEFINLRCSPEASILIFDADDEMLMFDPIPQKFNSALSELRSKSKNRSLRPVLPMELGAIGFELSYEDAIVVNNSFPHAHESLFKYMYRTAELGVGSPLPQDIQEELINWWLGRPYVQYGFFGQLYSQRKGNSHGN